VLCWDGFDDPLLLEAYGRTGRERVHAQGHVSDFDAFQRVLAEPDAWDVLNINSPFVRDALYPKGLIRELDAERFGSLGAAQAIPPAFRELNQWAHTADGRTIGVCQRFGPFNMVVDTAAISVATAEDQGFALAADPGNNRRYGILAYDDFNVLHIAIASGLDPFQALSEAAFADFAATAERWFAGARIVTRDHRALNRALLGGEIRFYLGGGIYTVSCARRDGHARLRAITPRHGPLQERGAIAFVEVNALLAHTRIAAEGERFLAFLLRPESAVRAVLADGAANPVLQMCDPAVFSQLGGSVLDAMQWDTLEEELDRCAQYRIAPDYARLHAILVAARRAAGWTDLD
jgi:spermidine/putrescine transport system substrate-binding protein